MAPKLPEPWAGFLADLDSLLSEPVELHCLGGFALIAAYGLPRPTGDLDFVSIEPLTLIDTVTQLAGEGSALWKEYGLCLQSVRGLANLPYEYASRVSEPFAGQFRNLRLMIPDPYDLILSKLERNQQKDREDVEYLAKQLLLDAEVLRTRYRDELRPIIIGDPARHNRTLAFWIQEYFPRAQGGPTP